MVAPLGTSPGQFTLNGTDFVDGAVVAVGSVAASSVVWVHCF